MMAARRHLRSLLFSTYNFYQVYVLSLLFLDEYRVLNLLHSVIKLKPIIMLKSDKCYKKIIFYNW